MASLMAVVIGFSSPSFSRQVDICQGQANFVAQVTELRDMGYPMEFLISMITYQDSASGRQAAKEVPEMIKSVFAKKNLKKTPEQMGKAFYKSCLGLPDWAAEETKV